MALLLTSAARPESAPPASPNRHRQAQAQRAAAAAAAAAQSQLGTSAPRGSGRGSEARGARGGAAGRGAAGSRKALAAKLQAQQQAEQPMWGPQQGGSARGLQAGGARRASYSEAIERRLQQRKPLEQFLEQLTERLKAAAASPQRTPQSRTAAYGGSMQAAAAAGSERPPPPATAPALPQLVLASATMEAESCQQVKALLGLRANLRTAPRHASPAEHAAAAAFPFAIVGAEAPHGAPRLRRRGAAAVRVPATIRHVAYIVRDATGERGRVALLAAHAELAPDAAVVVVPDSASVADTVTRLREGGIANAVALHKVLGLGDAERAAAMAAAAQQQRDEWPAGIGGEAAAARQARLGGASVGRTDGVGGAALERAGVQRAKLATAFKRRSSVPTVVTTESAARGLDLKAVDAVLLSQPPKSVDSYVHVAGRTGREGRKGTVVTVVPPERYGFLAELRKELGITIEEVDMTKLKGEAKDKAERPARGK